MGSSASISASSDKYSDTGADSTVSPPPHAGDRDRTGIWVWEREWERVAEDRDVDAVPHGGPPQEDLL